MPSCEAYLGFSTFPVLYIVMDFKALQFLNALDSTPTLAPVSIVVTVSGISMDTSLSPNFKSSTVTTVAAFVPST